MKDWIDQHEPDPRLPTDPDFVEVNALAENYGASRDTLVRFAIENPTKARRSNGNPWTESEHAREALFLHEPSVAALFKPAGR